MLFLDVFEARVHCAVAGRSAVLRCEFGRLGRHVTLLDEIVNFEVPSVLLRLPDVLSGAMVGNGRGLDAQILVDVH